MGNIIISELTRMYTLRTSKPFIEYRIEVVNGNESMYLYDTEQIVLNNISRGTYKISNKLAKILIEIITKNASSKDKIKSSKDKIKKLLVTLILHYIKPKK